MDTSNKNLKSPKELFEEKRLQALVELEYQNTKKSEQTITKKILPPKYFFRTDVVEEFSENNVNKNEEDTIIDELIEEVEDNFYSQQIEDLKNKLFEIENSIPEEVDLTEVIEYVNSLKEKIDNLPKPKDYSEDLNFIRSDLTRIENSIPIPEIFDPSDLYQNISYLKEKIFEVKSEIPILPEPILYDDQLDELRSIVENIRNNIPIIPEIKYYDEELKSILEIIEDVRSEIPELPEVKYYDDQISLIENRLSEIQESIPTVPEVKYYDEDLKNLQTEIDDVKNSIPSVPEVKYYDKDILSLNEEVKELYNKLSSFKVPNEDVYFDKVKTLYSSFEEKNNNLLKKINYLEEVFETFNEKTILQESLSEPPEVKNDDPLTPLDKNFVTLDQLQSHYKLFINRIQQQLATIGGGGETRLKYLDDVVGIATNASSYNGKYLKYNHGIGKFEFDTPSGMGGIGTDGSINTTGIITASSFYGDGSGLTGIIASGSGVKIEDNSSLVGTAATINFGNDLDVSFSSGVATINVSIPLAAITDVDTSNLTGISTDYLMVYDPGIPGFKFVDPKSYFGINNDFNPSPDIDDYGGY